MQGIGDGNLPVEFDPFNTPIPGQSLTDEPGNYPWEHAPKNVDPEIILERTWRGMTTPEAVEAFEISTFLIFALAWGDLTKNAYV